MSWRKENNVMVDLETLGNGSRAVIVAIGAVQFSGAGSDTEFYTTVDPQSCVDVGMVMDVSTVMWWMSQSDAARKAITQKGVPLADALFSLANWLPLNSLVWGNGATFDNAILSNAYSLVGMNKPWKYSSDRCYRTLKSLFSDIPVPMPIGTAHNALDDARYQAAHATTILGALGNYALDIALDGLLS